jgi:hypothetical protein
LEERLHNITAKNHFIIALKIILERKPEFFNGQITSAKIESANVSVPCPREYAKRCKVEKLVTPYLEAMVS